MNNLQSLEVFLPEVVAAIAPPAIFLMAIAPGAYVAKAILWDDAAVLFLCLS
jgi:hypothetical protein